MRENKKVSMKRTGRSPTTSDTRYVKGEKKCACLCFWKTSRLRTCHNEI